MPFHAPSERRSDAQTGSHFYGVQEAAGSNPVAPTTFHAQNGAYVAPVTGDGPAKSRQVQLSGSFGGHSKTIATHVRVYLDRDTPHRFDGLVRLVPSSGDVDRPAKSGLTFPQIN